MRAAAAHAHLDAIARRKHGAARRVLGRRDVAARLVHRDASRESLPLLQIRLLKGGLELSGHDRVGKVADGQHARARDGLEHGAAQRGLRNRRGAAVAVNNRGRAQVFNLLLGGLRVDAERRHDD